MMTQTVETENNNIIMRFSQCFLWFLENLKIKISMLDPEILEKVIYYMQYIILCSMSKLERYLLPQISANFNCSDIICDRYSQDDENRRGGPGDMRGGAQLQQQDMRGPRPQFDHRGPPPGWRGGRPPFNPRGPPPRGWNPREQGPR